jgi:diadenosine tetraphosphate (Ap4A) HIT family hydrolase
MQDDHWLKQLCIERIMIFKTLKHALNCDRIEEASLGNEVPHLHYHIIPRYVTESDFLKSPWPHKKINITSQEQIEMAKFLKDEFLKLWPSYEFKNKQAAIY